MRRKAESVGSLWLIQAASGARRSPVLGPGRGVVWGICDAAGQLRGVRESLSKDKDSVGGNMATRLPMAR